MFVAGLDAEADPADEFGQLQKDLRGALTPLGKSVIWPEGRDFRILLVEKVQLLSTVLITERENTTKELNGIAQPTEPAQPELAIIPRWSHLPGMGQKTCGACAGGICPVPSTRRRRGVDQGDN